MDESIIGVLAEIEKEKGISQDILIEAIESAVASAYKKNYGAKNDIEVNMNKDTGAIKVFDKKVVVKKVSNPSNEISIDELKLSDKDKDKYKIGDIIFIEITPREFGRIAAQTAKQVIVQKIREAERKLIYETYVDKERDIVTGIVQRIENRNVIMDLGRAEALLLPNEQIRNEEYCKGKRMKVYILEVRKTSKGPKILTSRTHPELLKRLFELEVPEIHEGLVEIKSIAREAGKRSKVAVYSRDEKVDPVGACIGDKGSRIKAIMAELKEEKIDIVRWSNDEKTFIANSLSPAKVLAVDLLEKERKAIVVVADQQLSLAIGKEGQNARLAAKLTNWKIDIKRETSQANEKDGQETDSINSSTNSV